ncbi:MAG: hypothetical protein HYV40_06625 [Candidatus Levybacteria bacterium]|nr:hypothetical protein [Candidatus Levybacteria bacterium]
MQQNFSLATIKLYYFTFKDTVYYTLFVICLFFLFGIVLLFQIVIPQFSQWFSVQQEVDVLRKDIAAIQENTRFLSSLDEHQLDNDLGIVTQAYPFTNDYGGIMNALALASARTGLALPNFSLTVGDIEQTVSPLTPTLYKLSFTFATDVTGARRFIDELSKILPIAAVTSIANGAETTRVDLQFYYHGYPSVVIDQKKKLVSLTPKERDLLSELRLWQGVIPAIGDVSGDEAPVATSGGAFPPPL